METCMGKIGGKMKKQMKKEELLDKEWDELSNEELLDVVLGIHGYEDDLENCLNELRELKKKEWFREAMWLYHKDDEKVMKALEEELKAVGFTTPQLWQNDVSKGYPQYLCSGDVGCLKGDTVHFWRDGQTYWPIVGDYSEGQMERAEFALKKALKKVRGD